MVLAFYPGDDTSVCTRQLCSYSTSLGMFADLDAEVWGISPQGVDSHEAFARRHGLSMPLLSDPAREVVRAFGVALPGIGLRRAVFPIGPDRVLRWRHVSLLGATFQPAEILLREIARLLPGR